MSTIVSSISSAAYRDLLGALLPPQAFDAGGAVLRAELYAESRMLAAAAGALEYLLSAEADPRSTYDMLADWERAYGLPLPCMAGIASTTYSRRDDLTAQVVAVGGQSAQYYIAVAAKLGYAITITYPAAHTWQVHAATTTISYFRCGASTCGERLATWGNERLECVLTRIKPAQTHLQFAYS